MSILIIGAIITVVIFVGVCGEIWHTRAMGRIPRTITDPQKEVRRNAVRTLARVVTWKNDTEAIELLVQSLSDPDWHIRHDAANILANTLVPNKEYLFKTSVPGWIPKIIEAFILVLQDRHPTVQAVAVKTLQQIQDDSPLLHPLLQRLEDIPLSSLLGAVNDQNSAIRREAVRFLGYTKNIHAIPALTTALHDNSDQVCQYAHRSLKKILGIVHAIVFGQKGLKILDPKHTVCDPDVADLTMPMPTLKEITILSTTAQRNHIEVFTHYMLEYIGKDYLQKHVHVHLHGNIGRFELGLYAPFAYCKHVNVHIKRIIFGSPISRQSQNITTLHNPELSEFLLPLSYLTQVDIYVDTCNLYQIEQFFTYAVNHIGQNRLKESIVVHIYGNYKNLNPNIRNNCINLCQRVYRHENNESSVL